MKNRTEQNRKNKGRKKGSLSRGRWEGCALCSLLCLALLAGRAGHGRVEKGQGQGVQGADKQGRAGLCTAIVRTPILVVVISFPPCSCSCFLALALPWSALCLPVGTRVDWTHRPCSLFFVIFVVCSLFSSLLFSPPPLHSISPPSFLPSLSHSSLMSFFDKFKVAAQGTPSRPGSMFLIIVSPFFRTALHFPHPPRPFGLSSPAPGHQHRPFFFYFFSFHC